jgi:anti-sigma factor RsiW
MTCEWRANLDRYLDGELPTEAAAEVEAHLRGCAGCAAEALSRLQLKRTTQAMGRQFVPRPEFRAKVEQSIRGGKRRRRDWGWQWSLAAAAAIALMAVSMVFWLGHSRGSQALSELADMHVSTLASPNPVDVVSSDRHTVKPWFQGKLPFSFNLPEPDGGPFRLLGGRVAYFRQSPGAHLLFQVREHRISVFVFQERPEAGGLELGSRPGFNVETWEEAGLRYVVIGDANRADIHELSELMKRAARS